MRSCSAFAALSPQLPAAVLPEGHSGPAALPRLRFVPICIACVPDATGNLTVAFALGWPEVSCAASGVCVLARMAVRALGGVGAPVVATMPPTEL